MKHLNSIKLIATALILSFIVTSCSKKNDSSPKEEVVKQEQINWSVGEGEANGDLAFGLVEFNESKILSVVIKNTGEAKITGNLNLSNSNFNIVYQSGCNDIDPGKSCSIKLQFSALDKNQGLYESTLNLGEFEALVSAVISDYSSTDEIIFTVNANLVTDVIDFGNFNYKKSVVKNITILNNGLLPIEGVVEIQGSDFTKVYDSCSNKTFKPQARCMVKVFVSGRGKTGLIENTLTYKGESRNLKAQVQGATESSAVNSNLVYIINNSSFSSSTADLGTINTNSRNLINIFLKNNGTDTTPLISSDLPSGEVIYNACSSVYLNPNQSCKIVSKIITDNRGVYNFGLETTGYDSNKNINIQYQVRTPGDKIDCTAGLNNVALAEITWTGSEYSQCQIVSCESNHHVSSNVCEADVINCESGGGIGSMGWNGVSYGECIINQCQQANQHIENNICVDDTVACFENGGSGIKIWTGSEYSSCQINNCDLVSQHVENNFCVDNIQSCSLNGGIGTKSWMGQEYSECSITSCVADNQHIELNNCVDDTRSCFILGAEATETWNGTYYNPCTVQSCLSSSQHIENNTCQDNVKSCTITGANATQTWNGTTYGPCTANSCVSSSQHVENNVCVDNVKSCFVNNGTGNQTWNGSTYGPCTIVSCNANAHLENGTCQLNTRSCTIANGTGSQTWNGSGYGSCFVDSCNTASGYYDRGDNLSCQHRGTSNIYGLNGMALGGNGQITTGGIRLVQQTDGNLVIYRVNTPLWNSQIGLGCSGGCSARFQSDGNFVSKRESPFMAYYQSATSNVGAATFQFKDECPYYMVIHNAAGKAIWSVYSMWVSGGGGNATSTSGGQYNVRCGF